MLRICLLRLKFSIKHFETFLSSASEYLINCITILFKSYTNILPTEVSSAIRICKFKISNTYKATHVFFVLYFWVQTIIYCSVIEFNINNFFVIRNI